MFYAINCPDFVLPLSVVDYSELLSICMRTWLNFWSASFISSTKVIHAPVIFPVMNSKYSPFIRFCFVSSAAVTTFSSYFGAFPSKAKGPH